MRRARFGFHLGVAKERSGGVVGASREVRSRVAGVEHDGRAESGGKTRAAKAARQPSGTLTTASQGRCAAADARRATDRGQPSSQSTTASPIRSRSFCRVSGVSRPAAAAAAATASSRRRKGAPSAAASLRHSPLALPEKALTSAENPAARRHRRRTRACPPSQGRVVGA